MTATQNRTNAQKFTPTWGQATAPTQAPVPTTPAPVAMVTLPKRVFNTILGVAIGASALFVFTIGMSAGVKNAAAHQSSQTGTVASVTVAPSEAPTRRSPNAVEVSSMEKAQATHSFGCQFLWNEETQGYAVICGEPYSG